MSAAMITHAAADGKPQVRSAKASVICKSETILLIVFVISRENWSRRHVLEGRVTKI